MNPSTSLGTKSNVGKEKPSPSVRQAGSIRGLLGKWGVERGSVSKAGYHVNYRRRCSVNKFFHIPPDLVVACVTAHRKPPEVRIWRLSNQSRVGTVPPSTSRMVKK